MSKISNPTDNSQSLTDEALEKYVQNVIEPMAKQFEKDHKGKEIRYSDIEKFYLDLSDYLSKDPRIRFKIGMNEDTLKQMAGDTADRIIDDKNSRSDKLLHGFGEACKKIGFKQLGEICIQHVEKKNLRNQLDKIAKDVASTKNNNEFLGNSPSAQIAKPIANPKIGGGGMER